MTVPCRRTELPRSFRPHQCCRNCRVEAKSGNEKLQKAPFANVLLDLPLWRPDLGAQSDPEAFDSTNIIKFTTLSASLVHNSLIFTIRVVLLVHDTIIFTTLSAPLVHDMVIFTTLSAPPVHDMLIFTTLSAPPMHDMIIFTTLSAPLVTIC